MENTTYINELDATVINQPAPPNDQSGENLPAKIDSEQAEIAYETAEITYEAINTQLTEYEMAVEQTPAEITLNMLASEPAQINVLSTKSLEIIHESTETQDITNKSDEEAITDRLTKSNAITNK